MPEKNPYDFVPFEGKPTYGTTNPTAALISGLTGSIHFDLEILTPLCIHQDPGQSGVRSFAALHNQAVIPATSLKGMLRGVHEVVTNSTMGLLQSKPQGWSYSNVPRDYLPGQQRQCLTPSEALFGMVGTAGGDDAVGYAGHLFLHDLPVNVNLTPVSVSRPKGGQPKPAHRSFYFTPGQRGQILGRKFYYHQQDYKRVSQIYAGDRSMPTVKVESVPPGTHLHGQVCFFNIPAADLAALVYALVLEDGLAHKLGYGKPLGLGSVRIRITRLLVEQQSQTYQGIPARLLDYGEQTFDDWADRVAWLRDSAKDAWLKRSQGRTSYAAFATILCWPQTQNFIYPDFAFFRKERTLPKKTDLWTYQGRGASTYYPDRPCTNQTVQVGENPPVKPAAAETDALLDALLSETLQPVLPPPPPPPPQRRTGHLEQRGNTCVVIDAESKQEYPKIGDPPRKIQRLLKPGQPVPISYQIARRDLNGQETEVAEHLQLAKGGN